MVQTSPATYQKLSEFIHKPRFNLVLAVVWQKTQAKVCVKDVLTKSLLLSNTVSCLFFSVINNVCMFETGTTRPSYICRNCMVGKAHGYMGNIWAYYVGP